MRRPGQHEALVRHRPPLQLWPKVLHLRIRPQRVPIITLATEVKSSVISPCNSLHTEIVEKMEGSLTLRLG